MTNAALQRVYTRASIRRLTAGDTSLLDHILPGYVKSPDGQTYGKLLDETYAWIGKNYRFEYYYKNELLGKFLLQKASRRKAVLTELPIGEAKADFVLIGQEGTVYEIKTAYDNLDRLDAQLKNYYKAFEKVVVVTCKEHLQSVLSETPGYVGVSELTARGAVRTVRPSRSHDEDYDYDAMIRILRKPEYEDILNREGLHPQTKNDFIYYRECTALLKSIDLQLLHKRMLQELVLRIDEKAAAKCADFPESLQLLVYLDSFDTGRNASLLKKALNREYEV